MCVQCARDLIGTEKPQIGTHADQMEDMTDHEEIGAGDEYWENTWS